MLLNKVEKEVVEEVNPYSWPENYYMETKPEKRKAILDGRMAGEIRDTGVDSEAEQKDASKEADDNYLRLELWEHRYEKMRKGDIKDCFLAAWLDLMLLGPMVDSKFGRKNAKRQAIKAIDQMCIPQVEHYGKELLLEELKHTVLLYCCTSMEDRQYSTIIFGFGRMKMDKIKLKLTAELQDVGISIPEKLGLKEEMALLTEAIEMAKVHLGL